MKSIFKNKSLRYEPPTFRPLVSLYNALRSVPCQNRTWHAEYLVASVDRSPTRHNIQLVKTPTHALHVLFNFTALHVIEPGYVIFIQKRTGSAGPASSRNDDTTSSHPSMATISMATHGPDIS